MVLYLICNIVLKYHFFPVESGIKCFAPAPPPQKVLNYMLMCNWLSFNFKSILLGRKRPGKRVFNPFLHKGTLWESEGSGSFSQKLPACVPFDLQFLRASGASEGPSIAKNLIAEVILESASSPPQPWAYEIIPRLSAGETRVAMHSSCYQAPNLWCWHFP